ncbi:potassium-transporting ATPase subunit F [Halalkalibacter alkalisediminis]|uniref:Potassium-transporting ATPase subunit F n=1 Tax=Halalkalibacter alkalisediminis TaxID=935616 RepID=A0ABV6NN52_9BACI
MSVLVLGGMLVTVYLVYVLMHPEKF